MGKTPVDPLLHHGPPVPIVLPHTSPLLKVDLWLTYWTLFSMRITFITNFLSLGPPNLVIDHHLRWVLWLMGHPWNIVPMAMAPADGCTGSELFGLGAVFSASDVMLIGQAVALELWKIMRITGSSNHEYIIYYIYIIFYIYIYVYICIITLLYGGT